MTSLGLRWLKSQKMRMEALDVIDRNVANRYVEIWCGNWLAVERPGT